MGNMDDLLKLAELPPEEQAAIIEQAQKIQEAQAKLREFYARQEQAEENRSKFRVIRPGDE
jgi:diadenosine tetraphosphate (Ap4A) HIT family hydrolase